MGGMRADENWRPHQRRRRRLREDLTSGLLLLRLCSQIQLMEGSVYFIEWLRWGEYHHRHQLLFAMAWLLSYCGDAGYLVMKVWIVRKGNI
jgi:hypothetical protein